MMMVHQIEVERFVIGFDSFDQKTLIIFIDNIYPLGRVILALPPNRGRAAAKKSHHEP
jgi:hypothetical protein